MADFLKRYAADSGLDPNDPALPETIRQRLTGEDLPLYHTGQAADDRRIVPTWGEQVASGVTQDLLGQRHLLAALGNYVVGDQAAGVDRLRRWDENNQRVREVGPQFQDFEQIKDVKSGASVLGYQTAKLLPDMLFGLGVGGLLKKSAVTAAEAAATEAAARVLTTSAAKKAAQAELRKQGLAELKDTAAYAAADDAMKATLERGARQQADEAFAAGVQREARAGLDEAALKAIDKKGDVGFAVGATAGSIPSNLQEQGNFMLENQDLSQSEALKLLAGTVASASTDFIPLAGWLGRFSKKSQEARAAADKFAMRLVKATGSQMAAEGGQEAVQAFITRSSQKWVDENVGLFDEEAMQEYMMNFMAGSIMGGMMGAGGEIGQTGARAVSNAFGTAFKRLEAARLARANPQAELTATQPTGSTASAVAAAEASGRKINPVAQSVLNDGAPGDLSSQIKFSREMDEKSLSLLTELQKKVADYRSRGIAGEAAAYDANQTTALFPAGVRLNETGLPFANYAASFGFTGLDAPTEQLKASPVYQQGMLALEKIMRLGINSDQVQPEERAAYQDLVDLAPEPWRFTAVVALRELNPTLHSDVLAGVDAKIAELDQERATAESRPAETFGQRAATGLTKPLNADDSGAEPATGEVGNTEAATLSGNITASMLNRGNTPETAANALRRQLDTIGNSDLLLRQETEPTLMAVLNDPILSKDLGGPDAILGAYKRLEDLAAQRARLMKVNPESKRRIDNRMDKLVLRDPLLTQLANAVRARLQAEADTANAAATSSNSGVFVNSSRDINPAFAARRDNAAVDENGKPLTSAYVPAGERTLIDLGSQINAFLKSDAGMEERNAEGGQEKYQRLMQVLAQLATNPALPVDWNSMPWGKKITLRDGRTFTFTKKPQRLSGDKDIVSKKERWSVEKERAAQMRELSRFREWMAEGTAANKAALADPEAAGSDKAAKRAAEVARRKALKAARERGDGVEPTGSDAPNAGLDAGELADNTEPVSFSDQLMSEQRTNASGLADDVDNAGNPNTFNPNVASAQVAELRRKIRNEKPFAVIYELLNKLGIPGAKALQWSESRNEWRVVMDGSSANRYIDRAAIMARAPQLLEDPGLGAAFGYVAKNKEKQSFYFAEKNMPKTNADLAALVRKILISKIDPMASPRSIAQQTEAINALKGEPLRKALADIEAGKYDSGRVRVYEEKPQQFVPMRQIQDSGPEQYTADELRSQMLAMAKARDVEPKYVLYALKHMGNAMRDPALKTVAQRMTAAKAALKTALEKTNKEFRADVRAALSAMNTETDAQLDAVTEFEGLLSPWLSKRAEKLQKTINRVEPTIRTLAPKNGRDERLARAPAGRNAAEDAARKAKAMADRRAQRQVEMGERLSEKAPKVDKPVNEPKAPPKIVEKELTAAGQEFKPGHLLNLSLPAGLFKTKAGERRLKLVAKRRENAARREAARQARMTDTQKQVEAAWRRMQESQAAERARVQQPARGDILSGMSVADVVQRLLELGTAAATRWANRLMDAEQRNSPLKDAEFLKAVEAAKTAFFAGKDKTGGSIVAEWEKSVLDPMIARHMKARDARFVKLFDAAKAELRALLAPENQQQKNADRRGAIPAKPDNKPDQRAKARARLSKARGNKTAQERAYYNWLLDVNGMRIGESGALEDLEPSQAEKDRVSGEVVVKGFPPTEMNDPKLKASVAADWSQRPITDAEHKKTVAGYVQALTKLVGSRGAQALVRSGLVSFVTRDNLPPFAQAIGRGTQAFEYDGKIYVLADAPLGNAAGVLLHESLHAHMKTVLGEDFEPLLKELARMAGLAQPGARSANTLVESQLEKRLPLTDTERPLFDQALLALSKTTQDGLKAELNEALKEKNVDKQRALISAVFAFAAMAKQSKAINANVVIDPEKTFTPETVRVVEAAQSWLLAHQTAASEAMLVGVPYTKQRSPSAFDVMDHNSVMADLFSDMLYDLKERNGFNALETDKALKLLFAAFPRLGAKNINAPALNILDVTAASADAFVEKVKVAATAHQKANAQDAVLYNISKLKDDLKAVNVDKEHPDYNVLLFAGAVVQTHSAPKGNTDWRPRIINTNALKAAAGSFASARNMTFANHYNSVVNGSMSQFVVFQASDGQWRRHAQAKPEDGPEKYDLAVMSVQTNSHTGWCIKTPEYSNNYLQKGDIWLFNAANGDPRLAIRFDGAAVGEIQEPQNDRTVSELGQRRLVELAKTGLIDTTALLNYAKDWGFVSVAKALGDADAITAAEQKAASMRGAYDNGLMLDANGDAVVEGDDLAVNAAPDGMAEFDAHLDALFAQGLAYNAAGEVVPVAEADAERAREQEARNRAQEELRARPQAEPFNDVPFSVATDGDLGATSDADWVARGRARVQFAGVSPDMQAEEFAAYAVENYELAPAGFQKWVDTLMAKFKLKLSALLRKLKVAPRWRVQLLNDPAVLREIALVGLRTAAGRAESSTNFGAGSVWGETAVSARMAAERVFGKVFGSVKAERLAEAARKIRTDAPRGYRDPDPRILNVDVHNLNLFLNEVLTPAQRQALYDLAHGTYGDFFRKHPAAYAMMIGNKYGREYTLYNLYSAYKGGALGEVENERGMRYAMKMIAGKARQFFDIYTSDDLAQQILFDLSDGTLETAAATNAPYQPELRLRGKQSTTGNMVQSVIDATTKAHDVFQKIFYNDYDVARASGIAAYDEIINRLQYRSGDRLAIGPDGKVNRGMLSAVQHKTGYFLAKMDKAVAGLTKQAQEKVARELYYNLPEPRPGTLTPAETEAFNAVRAVYREAGQYGVESGVLEAGAVRGNPDYTPVVFDVGGNVEKHKATLREIFSQHDVLANGKKRYKYAKMLDALWKEKNPQDALFESQPDAQQLQFIDQVVEYALFDPSDVVLDNQLGNKFKHAGRRLFDDVFKNYRAGDTADLDKLVTTLEPSLGEQGVRYVEPLVVRAEYNRAFPDGLDNKLIEQMRRQGATAKQLEAASRVLNAAQFKFDFPIYGPNGEKGSPTIGLVSKTLAMKMHNRKTLRTMQNLSAWQNLRLLPLALLSSIVDPQGIAIRSGGDLGVAFSGLKSGLRGIVDPKMQDALHQLAEAAGYSAEMSAAQALHDGFGAGSRTPWARKMNSLMFKWNGLELWTRQTRYMAMVAAHGSLAKWQAWARGDDPAKKAQAERYLSELGLQVDDIRIGEISDGPLAGKPTVLLLSDAQKANATPAQLAADERVKGALVQFVDEAILRPNLLQTPGWFKDPFVQIIVQYKAFTYALFEQISRRITLELSHENFRVLGAALSYLPFILLAELLREFIQWGPDGNPQRAQWSAVDYTGLAVAKTGFAGPRMDFGASVVKDAERGDVPGVSALGPTVGAAAMIKDSATGQRGWGSTIESLLPGSAAWKRWNDDPGGAASDGAGLTRKPVPDA